MSALLSARHAAGAAVGLAIVMVTHGVSNLSDGWRWWSVGVTLVLAIELVDLLPTIRRLLPVSGLAPATLLAALVATALCVPETGQIPVAAFVPVLVVVVEVIGRRQLVVEWYGVAAASVLWAGLFGASGRQSALVGALFAWWVVALVPLVNMVRPIRSWGAGLLVVSIGAIAVVVVARTGGIADSGVEAVAAAGVASLVSFGVGVLAVDVLNRRLSATP